MDNHTSETTRRWIPFFESIALGATILAAMVVSLLDFLGFLENLPWLAQRLPTLTLLIVALIGTYLVIERRTHIERWQAQSQKGFVDLENAIANSTTTIVKSLSGVELRVFANGNEMMRYINKRLPQAKRQVLDLSWSPATSVDSGLRVAQDLNAQYDRLVDRVAQQIPFREVFMFNRFGREEKLRRRLAQSSAGYTCGFYEPVNVPLLQFMIIDNEEVILLSDQLESRVAIKSPPVVGLFKEYYNDIWAAATKIKDETGVKQDVVTKLLGKTDT